MKEKIILVLVVCLSFQLNAQIKHIKTSDDVELFVTIKGKGMPCLFIHGGPGSGSYWFEKFVGDSLEQHFQMIYLDQRGVGRSSSPDDGDFSMDRMVTDFEEVREALGIQEWIIMGHSFGGILQMGYVLRYPQSIKGMIMINCTINIESSYKTSWCPKACKLLDVKDSSYFIDDAIPLTNRWDSLIHALNEKDLMWKMGFSNRDDMMKIGQTYGDIPNWNWDFEGVALKMSDYRHDFLNETANVQAPVLFIYGKKDWMVGPFHYKKVKFPNMLLDGIDANHMSFLDNIEEVVNSIIKYKVEYF